MFSFSHCGETKEGKNEANTTKSASVVVVVVAVVVFVVVTVLSSSMLFVDILTSKTTHFVKMKIKFDNKVEPTDRQTDTTFHRDGQSH